MDTKDKVIAVLAGVIVLAIGIGLGVFGEYHFAVQAPRARQQAMIQKQQAQLKKETRSGRLVSFDAGSVTVQTGDVGKTETYKITRSTNVQKDYAMVSKYGQKPDLAALGLKDGYHVNLLVNNGNVVDIQFNSGGGKTPVRSGKQIG